MARQRFSMEHDGFHGTFYPSKAQTSSGFVIMVGDDSDDYLARRVASWFVRRGIAVVATSPAKKDYGHHSYPVECVERAVAWLQGRGCERVGIMGVSTTGMLALVAASLIPSITLTLAFTASDFVMEGFYRDGLDGTSERPGDYESSLSWHGEQLPFLPYAFRHPEYDQQIKAESKRRGDLAASRDLFDESERRHPVQEAEFIKVEDIKGQLVVVACEDDVLWDACRYARRMGERFARLPHECSNEFCLYEHGTHFCLPQSMVRAILPVGFDLLLPLAFKEAKGHTAECRASRENLDRRIGAALDAWMAGA